MSGTSADGVDVAVTAITTEGPRYSAKLLHLASAPYHGSLSNTIHTIRTEGVVALPRLAACGRAISLAYSDAIGHAMHALNLSPEPGDGCLRARPNAVSRSAEHNSVDRPGAGRRSHGMRRDFRLPPGRLRRRRAGRAASPLCRLPHVRQRQRRSRHRQHRRDRQRDNHPPRPAASVAVRAFDTGPGNCISDAIVRRSGLNPFGVDLNGELAATGQVDESLVARFAADPYFQQEGPKSTDGPRMLAIFDQILASFEEPNSPHDQLATACFITAQLIARAIPRDEPTEVFVAGGGVRNQTLMQMLREAIGTAIPLQTTDDVGIPSQAREAMAFAILGAATLDSVPASLPACTGAAHATILGSITPRQTLES